MFDDERHDADIAAGWAADSFGTDDVIPARFRKWKQGVTEMVLRPFRSKPKKHKRSKKVRIAKNKDYWG